MCQSIPSPDPVNVRHVGDNLTFTLSDPAAQLLTLQELQQLAGEVGDRVQGFIGRILGSDAHREAGEVDSFLLGLLGVFLVGLIGAWLVMGGVVIAGLMVMAMAPALAITLIVRAERATSAENRRLSTRQRPEPDPEPDRSEVEFQTVPEVGELETADDGSAAVGIVVVGFALIAPVMYALVHLAPAVTR